MKFTIDVKNNKETLYSFVIFCLLLLSGCKSITEDDNYIEKIYNCLKNDSMTNTVALGYKYYLPKGVKKLKDYDYNQAFLVDNCYLYLYVDIISYYYEKELQKPNEEDTYYYETIEHDNKNGYILIKETAQEQYYLTIVYNYSKIEGYVSKNKINSDILAKFGADVASGGNMINNFYQSLIKTSKVVNTLYCHSDISL